MNISKMKIASVKRLLQKKYREEAGMFIVEGWKSVEEAMNANANIETLIYNPIDKINKKLLAKLQGSINEIFEATEKEMQTISDTVTTQGIIAVVKKMDSESALDKIRKKSEAVIVSLETMNDPGNLGTIVRTCDWFGVDALVIGENSVELYNPKVVRATMGSIFHFPIIENVNLEIFLRQSQKDGFTIYSSELKKSDDIREIQWQKKSVILIGSESHGISEKISALADKKIFIPKYGKAESLNAAMACGIILSQITLNHKN